MLDSLEMSALDVAGGTSTRPPRSPAITTIITSALKQATSASAAAASPIHNQGERLEKSTKA